MNIWVFRVLIVSIILILIVKIYQNKFKMYIGNYYTDCISKAEIHKSKRLLARIMNSTNERKYGITSPNKRVVPNLI